MTISVINLIIANVTVGDWTVWGFFWGGGLKVKKKRFFLRGLVWKRFWFFFENS